LEEFQSLKDQPLKTQVEQLEVFHLTNLDKLRIQE
jgi:hypothetical protein